MALGSTQPLVKMSTRNIPGGKGGRCRRLTTYHHYCAVVKNSRSLNFLDPSGPAWPVTGVLYLSYSQYTPHGEHISSPPVISVHSANCTMNVKALYGRSAKCWILNKQSPVNIWLLPNLIFSVRLITKEILKFSSLLLILERLQSVL